MQREFEALFELHWQGKTEVSEKSLTYTTLHKPQIVCKYEVQ
jgi:hypothetical protein